MLAIITTYFNHNNCKYRLDNYQTFLNKIKEVNLPLFTVELALDNKPFHLSQSDGDLVLQIRTKSKMFQKERLLNVALQNLPKKYTNVCWMDCDLVYLDNDWPERIELQLEKYVIIQPFQYAAAMPQGKIGFLNNSLISFENCTGSALLRKSFAYCNSKNNGQDPHKGHVGYVWAAQRDFLDNVKFYDPIITGAGDLFMAIAFFGKPGWFDHFSSLKFLSDEAYDHYFDWATKVSEIVKNNVGYTEDLIIHLWHGPVLNRDYLTRSGCLQKHKFNPLSDIKISNDGCWEWSSAKPRLHKEIHNILCD